MDRTWWCQVTNAVNFVNHAIKLVLEEKHLVLELPANLPWYSMMKQLIEEGLRKSSDRITERIADSPQKPGEYILEHFCKKEIRDEYRPSIGYATFLANCDNILLNERFVWITDIVEEHCSEWAEFISDYAKKSGGQNKRGVFILEARNGSKFKNKKGIEVLSFQEEVDTCDSLVFNMLATSQLKESDQIKKYLAELVSSIAGGDIELCAQCVCKYKYKKFLSAPYETIKEIEQKEYRSNGERFLIDKNRDEIEKLVWKAQIKVLFPVIEEYRERFVSKYYDEIDRHLPISNTFGQEYTEPMEVELGTLYYMAVNGKIDVTEEEKKEVNLYKNARNNLAHLMNLDIREIRVILCSVI